MNRPLLLSATALAFLIVVAACGEDDGDAADEILPPIRTTTTTTTTSTTTRHESDVLHGQGGRVPLDHRRELRRHGPVDRRAERAGRSQRHPGRPDDRDPDRRGARSTSCRRRPRRRPPPERRRGGWSCAMPRTPTDASYTWRHELLAHARSLERADPVGHAASSGCRCWRRPGWSSCRRCLSTCRRPSGSRSSTWTGRAAATPTSRRSPRPMASSTAAASGTRARPTRTPSGRATPTGRRRCGRTSTPSGRTSVGCASSSSNRRTVRPRSARSTATTTTASTPTTRGGWCARGSS